MGTVRLVDMDDRRLYPFTSVGDAVLRESEDSPHGLFVAESARVIERAMDAGMVPYSAFVEERWAEQSSALLERIAACNPDAPVFLATHAQMQQVTGYQVTRGPLAAFNRPRPADPADLLAGARRVAVLEDVTNFTNIGAAFRSAAALGIDAVLVTPSCHDPLYKRASRVSMGTVFQVPWARIGSKPRWSDEGVPLLRAHGFRTVALALDEDALDLRDPRLAACERLAMVLGTEGDGLSPSTVAACDWTARIPMAHDVDSLNVAAASSVAFWELCARGRMV